MKKNILYVLALMIVGLVAVSGLVMATDKETKHSPIQELREQVIDAIEANDYDAWETAWENYITEENFNRVVEKYNNFLERMEHRQEIKQAIEDNDYEAWVDAVNDAGIELPFEMNEDNFELVVELHEAMQDHDMERVKELREQLGLPKPKKPRFGLFKKFGWI